MNSSSNYFALKNIKDPLITFKKIKIITIHQKIPSKETSNFNKKANHKKKIKRTTLSKNSKIKSTITSKKCYKKTFVTKNYNYNQIQLFQDSKMWYQLSLTYRILQVWVLWKQRLYWINRTSLVRVDNQVRNNNAAWIVLMIKLHKCYQKKTIIKACILKHKRS